MDDTLYSVVIPTHNRPALLARAIESALSQTLPGFEVIVVDDGSQPPSTAPTDPRVRLVRLDHNCGNAAARNAGLAVARGQWITFLDDDDVLLPHMAESSLTEIKRANLPAPVAAISGVEVVESDGSVVGTRLPPTCPRGSHFALEKSPAGTSFLCKQTLFVECSVLRDLGGFDENFRSRVPTELFLRLNPVCSIVGVRDIAYRQYRHGFQRVSTDKSLRVRSFDQLVAKHRQTFIDHPRGFARLLKEHARTLWRAGDHAGALRARAKASTVGFSHFFTVIARNIRRSFGRRS